MISDLNFQQQAYFLQESPSAGSLRNAVLDIRESCQNPWGFSRHRDERRAAVRHRINTPVHVFPTRFSKASGLFLVQTDEFDIGVTRDISCQGVGWRQLVPSDTKFHLLEFFLPNRDTPVRLIALCRWSRNRPEGVEIGSTLTGIAIPTESVP